MKKKIVKKYPCIESTIETTTKDDKFIVRLWVDKDALTNVFIDEATYAEAIALMEYKNISDLTEKIIKAIPRLNAVQIKFNSIRHSLGLMVYTVHF